MQNKERNINLYLSGILLVGLAVFVRSIYKFPLDRINSGLIALTIVTVFFSSYLRIQLPRTKIHLTVSDALILLSLLIYGGEVSVILAALEAAYLSLNLRRKGISIKTKTILFNVAVAVISVFSTAAIVKYFFNSPETVVSSGSNTHLFVMMAVMAAVSFIVNSVCISIYAAFKTQKSVWSVWNEYCLNALVIYFTGAILAGITVKALQPVNILLVAVGAISAWALSAKSSLRVTASMSWRRTAGAKVLRAEVFIRP